jgi:hypothetical protein
VDNVIRCLDGEYEPAGFEDVDEDIALPMAVLREIFEPKTYMEQARAVAALSEDRFDRLFIGRHRTAGNNLRRAGKNITDPLVVKLFIKQRSPARAVIAAGATKHKGNVEAQLFAASVAINKRARRTTRQSPPEPRKSTS